MRSAAGLRVQSAGCYGITGRAREWNGHADIPHRIPPKDSLILTIIFNGPTFTCFLKVFHSQATLVTDEGQR